MPVILRATNRDRGTHGVVFNFDDMAVQADRYLERIRGEAAKIVLQAQQEAVAIRRQAEHEGQQAALQATDQMIRKQLASVLPALARVVEEIQHAKQAWLRHWETRAIHLAAAIAARVIRRELSQQPDLPLALTREALELAAGNSRIRVHLNPSDHSAIRAQVEMLTQEMATLTSTEVISNPEITRGGCRVETDFGVIDQQIEAQLARIEEELVG